MFYQIQPADYQQAQVLIDSATLPGRLPVYSRVVVCKPPTPRLQGTKLQQNSKYSSLLQKEWRVWSK